MPKFLTDDQMAQIESGNAPIKKVGLVESGLRGASQGASMGFSDEAAGVGGALAEAIHGSGPDLIGRVRGAYTASRDTERQENEAAQKANPITYGASNLGGAVVTAAAPVSLYGKVAQGTNLALGTVKGAGLLGALQGGVTGLGETKDITSPKALIDVAVPAAIGGLTGAALQKIANTIRPENAADVAEEITKQTTATNSQQSTLTKEATSTKTKTFNKTVDKESKTVSKILSKDPKDVAHFEANRDRILGSPSLDENARNPLSQVIANDFDALKNRLAAREEAASKLIEQSGAGFRTGDIVDVFQNTIDNLQNSGASKTKTTQAAIKELQSYIRGFADDEGRLVDEVWDGAKMRQFIQGLWKDNKSFYVPGKDASPVEDAIGEVANNLNERVLKPSVKGFGELMEQYSNEVRVYKDFRKLTDTNNWFKNRILKPVQDKLEGVATDRLLHDAQKSWQKTLSDFQKMVGRNYEQIINDQLVFGRLFPELAQGGQHGSLTTQVGRALGALAQGNIGTTMKESAKTAAEATVGLSKRAIQEELLTGTKTKTSSLIKKVVNTPRAAQSGLAAAIEYASRRVPATKIIDTSKEEK